MYIEYVNDDICVCRWNCGERWRKGWVGRLNIEKKEKNYFDPEFSPSRLVLLFLKYLHFFYMKYFSSASRVSVTFFFLHLVHIIFITVVKV